MNHRWIIGLTSGTSSLGVEAVLLEIEGVGLDLQFAVVKSLHQPYGFELQQLIASLVRSSQLDSRQLGVAHRLVGETLATAARRVADEASLSLQEVQCIGCAGLTPWHETDGRIPYCFSLGMPAVVAERTGVTVVSDFRSRDLAAGGQGGPLLAILDHLLFHHPGENRVVIHLGGMARVIYLPAGGRLDSVMGFEAGPCNVLLDGLIREGTCGRELLDPGGRYAVQGRCLEVILQRWLGHPYLARRPPKVVPRRMFGEEFARDAISQVRELRGSMNDLLCTANHFVARGVAEAVKRLLPLSGLPDRILLCGGGVRNGLLWQLLEQQFSEVVLERTDVLGVPAILRKALGFAVLAALTLDGVPASLPSATGAAGARLLGSLTPGSSLNWARCLGWMATQTAPLALVDE